MSKDYYIEQLRNFVEWEKEHTTKRHIAEWALEEIESLRARLVGRNWMPAWPKFVQDECLQVLRNTQPPAPKFQDSVASWMRECFLPSLYDNMVERGDRVLEEVLEMLQSKGYDRSRVATLVDYVYNRPPGEPSQEVGGVMVTLAAFCWIAGLDMEAAGNAELERINKPDIMAKIRAKQEAKNALHFDTPLPGQIP